MDIRVSIVVAAFNAEKYIGNALASALRQTEPRFEVIVVDDGSTDHTPEIVEYFAAQDPRIRLIRTKHNGGCAPARNRALEAARGEWITILDADDRFAPRRLEIMLDHAQRYEADFLADNLLLCEVETGDYFDVMLPGLTETRRLSPAEFIRRNLPGPAKTKYGLLKPFMRRSFLDGHGLRYDEKARFASDFLLYSEALFKGCRFVLVPDALYCYGLTPGAITRVRTLDHIRYVAGRVYGFAERREVRSDPDLLAAVEELSRAYGRDITYNAIVEPLRHWRLDRFLADLARHPGMLPYVAARLVQAAKFRFRRRLRKARPLAEAGDAWRPVPLVALRVTESETSEKVLATLSSGGSAQGAL
jgi:glycosyltransferase involved in cell wall biosynthesis